MRAYSRYWRRQISRHTATELALALRALRKVAGHLGRNVKPVFWKGMEPVGRDAILLNPGPIQGSFPIPFDRFDLLVGQVVHEGLGSIEWKDWVTANVRKALSDLPEEIVPYLDAFLDAAEDIYLDELARPQVWSLYLSRFWKADLRKDARDPGLPPSARSLAQVWKKQEICGARPSGLHQDYQDALRSLADTSSAIREIASLSSRVRRRHERIRLYREAWSILHGILSDWERFSVLSDAIHLFDEAAPKAGLPDRERPGPPEEREEEGQDDSDASDGLDEELADRVRELVADDGEAELTRRIIAAVEDPEAGSMRTILRRGTARSSVHPDPVFVHRIRKIFKEHEGWARRTRRRHIRRGLIEGKLDAHRLFRVPLDGKVFKDRQPSNLTHFWEICVLADASASMAGRGVRRKPWPVAEKAFASLAEAAKGGRNLLDIYAYHEEENQCVLTQLYHGGSLFTVLPAGRTPSGQAIIAAALMLRKRYRNGLILHITDGASNCGARLSDAVDMCKRHRIDLFTIGCGCSRQTEEFLKHCFPGNRLCFLDNIRGLPLVVEQLLRERLLLGPRRESSHRIRPTR